MPVLQTVSPRTPDSREKKTTCHSCLPLGKEVPEALQGQSWMHMPYTSRNVCQSASSFKCQHHNTRGRQSIHLLNQPS